jgi:hypothetical protein
MNVKGFKTGANRDLTGPSIRAMSSSVAARIESGEAKMSGVRISLGGYEMSDEGVGRLYAAT